MRAPAAGAAQEQEQERLRRVALRAARHGDAPHASPDDVRTSTPAHFHDSPDNKGLQDSPDKQSLVSGLHTNVSPESTGAVRSNVLHADPSSVPSTTLQAPRKTKSEKEERLGMGGSKTSVLWRGLDNSSMARGILPPTTSFADEEMAYELGRHPSNMQYLPNRTKSMVKAQHLKNSFFGVPSPFHGSTSMHAPDSDPYAGNTSPESQSPSHRRVVTKNVSFLQPGSFRPRQASASPRIPKAPTTTPSGLRASVATEESIASAVTGDGSDAMNKTQPKLPRMQTQPQQAGVGSPPTPPADTPPLAVTAPQLLVSMAGASQQGDMALGQDGSTPREGTVADCTYSKASMNYSKGRRRSSVGSGEQPPAGVDPLLHASAKEDRLTLSGHRLTPATSSLRRRSTKQLQEQQQEAMAVDKVHPKDDDDDELDPFSSEGLKSFSLNQRRIMFAMMVLTVFFANYDSGALAAMYGMKPTMPDVVFNATDECDWLWYDFLQLDEGPANYKALAASETPGLYYYDSVYKPLVGVATRARTQYEAMKQAMGSCEEAASLESSNASSCRIIYPASAPVDIVEITTPVADPAWSSASAGELLIIKSEVACTTDAGGECYVGTTTHGHSGTYPANHTTPFRGGSVPVTLTVGWPSGAWTDALRVALLKAVADSMGLPQPDTAEADPARKQPENAATVTVAVGVIDEDLSGQQARLHVRFINRRNATLLAQQFAAKCSSPSCLGGSWTVKSASIPTATWSELDVSLLHDPNFDRLYTTLSVQGLLSAIVYTGLVIGSLLSMWALDAYPPRLVVTVSISTNIAFALMFAVSWNRTGLFVSRLLVGASQATLVAYAPTWVTHFAPRESMGLWLSLTMAGVPLGIVLGYAMAGVVSQSTTWSWKWVFLIQGFCLAPCVLYLLITPAAWHVPQTKKDDTDRDEHRLPGEPKSSRSFSESVVEMLRNSTLWLATMSCCSLYFVVNGLQAWVTPYLTDKCTPVTEELTTVITMFGIVAITGPIIGVVIGGVSLDCIGGYATGPRRAAGLGFFFGTLAAGVSVLSLFMTSFWPFIMLVWFTLIFGGAVVPSLTGVVIASVDETLRTIVVAYASTHYNLWGYQMGPFLCGLVASLAQADPGCSKRLSGQCYEIGCPVKGSDAGGCADPYGLTWGFRLVMAWAVSAAVLAGFTYIFCKRMVKENDAKTRSVRSSADGTGIIHVFYLLQSSNWAWRHETLPGVDGGEPEPKGDPQPCCWMEVQLGEYLPTAQVASRHLLINRDEFLAVAADPDDEATMYYPFQAKDDMRLGNCAIPACDPNTEQEINLGEYFHWRLVCVITEGGMLVHNCTTPERFMAFIKQRTDPDEIIMIVLEDGRLWDAYIEETPPYCRNPRCCRPSVPRLDLLNPGLETDPFAESASDELYLKRRAALTRILHSTSKRKFDQDLLEELHLPKTHAEAGLITLVYSKCAEDLRLKRLQRLYEKAVAEQDDEKAERYRAMIRCLDDSCGQKHILVIVGEERINCQADVTMSVKELVEEIGRQTPTTPAALGGKDAVAADGDPPDAPPALWMHRERLDPNKRLSHYKMANGTILTMRLPSWSPPAELTVASPLGVTPEPSTASLASNAPKAAAAAPPRAKPKALGEAELAKLQKLADQEQYRLPLSTSSTNAQAKDSTLETWVEAHFGCCRTACGQTEKDAKKNQ